MKKFDKNKNQEGIQDLPGPKLTSDNRVIRWPESGLSRAVFARVVQRTKPDGTKETWSDVAERVAKGNCGIHESGQKDLELMTNAIKSMALLMSGRHLQHGDETQPGRDMTVFTNCSTAAFSHMLFLLLLSGSGVGRSYDDELMLVDWKKLPEIKFVLSSDHKDHEKAMLSASVRSLMDNRLLIEGYKETSDYDYHKVDDSREGWAKVVEIMEMSAFTGSKQGLVFDFSGVRPEGSPIHGMQDRPASGPVPFMQAIADIVSILKIARDENWMPWKVAMFVDHYLAACVVVGGARRSARIATKIWTDPQILEFINLKNEWDLWSANNSVGCTEDFWDTVSLHFATARESIPESCLRAVEVFETATEAQHGHMTGEPGFVNLHKLSKTDRGLNQLSADNLIDRRSYDFDDQTKKLYQAMIDVVRAMKYQYIVNPCGEIALFVLGGFCVIADVVPYYCKSVSDFYEVCKLATRALIRTNLLKSPYSFEVSRTNRIGVGCTGIHEFAYKFFGANFADLIDASSVKGLAFWDVMAIASREIVAEARRYSKELGVVEPATDLTFKPAGTTSKLRELSEGPHRPARRRYKRNVLFLKTDPLVAMYRDAGFPIIEDLQSYPGQVVVGFPTEPEICKIMPEEEIVTATEATLAQDFRFLMNLEDAWLSGAGAHPEKGNQISYTMKFDVEHSSLSKFQGALAAFMPHIKACSFLPYSKTKEQSYEYLPEEEVSQEEFVRLSKLKDPAVQIDEVVTIESLQCDSGICPI